MSTLSHMQTRRHGDLSAFRLQLRNQLEILIGKGQYCEFVYSKLYRRYNALPPVIQNSQRIRAFDRQTCRRALSPDMNSSKIQLLGTALKQASQHVSAQLLSWDLNGAEHVLLLAETDLHKLEAILKDVENALKPHESLYQTCRFLHCQLRCLDAALEGFEDKYESLEDRAMKINPILGRELVTPYSFKLCRQGFDLDMSPEGGEIPFEHQMDRLEGILETGGKALDICDIQRVQQILVDGEQGVKQMQTYLSDLEIAVLEFETANMMTPYYFNYFDHDEVKHQMCSSPSSFDTADEIRFRVACEKLNADARKKARAKKEAGITLKNRAARVLTYNDKGMSSTRRKNNANRDAVSRQMKVFKDISFDMWNNHRAGFTQKAIEPRILSNEDSTSGAERGDSSSESESSGSSGLSYKDFDLLDHMEDAEQTFVSTPTKVHSPKAVSMARKGAVMKLIAGAAA